MFLLPKSVQEFQINYNLTKNLKIQRFKTDDSHSIAHHDCFVSKQGCAIEITKLGFFFCYFKIQYVKTRRVLHILKNEV